MSKKDVTYSEKSDRHAEHKHLFGSGGKSDFIINMSAEGTQKLCGVYSMIAMILLALSAVPYYIAKAVGTSDTYMMLRTENNETLAFLIMTLLIATGFLGMLIFMICCVKKEIVLKRNKSLLIFAAIIVSALISTLASSDIGTSLFGYLDRAEGLITIIGYIGFFTIGISLTSEKWRKKVSGTIVAIGTVNAVMGILQSIPALAKYIPSYYNYLFIGYRTDVTFAEYFNNYAAYDASYAADGFCCSPFALGALLTVACAFAVNNACYGKKTISRLANLAAAGIMTGAAIATQTFPAMLGVGCVLIISLITSAVNYAGEKKRADDIDTVKTGKQPIVMSAISIVMAGAVFGGIFITGNYRMRNEHIIFTDSFERLGIAYNAHSTHDDGIYPTLWYDGLLCLESENAILGVGPDNWIEMYASGEGMETDRTYNEYLDIAVMRGILGAVIYIAMIIMTFVKALKIVKAAAKGRIGTLAYGVFGAFTAYAIQAFFNISTASSTPFFFLTIGIIWSYSAKTKKYSSASSV